MLWQRKWGRRKAYQLDRVFDEITGYPDDASLLADPVDSVDRLRLHHGVPMRLHDVDVIGSGKVDTVLRRRGKQKRSIQEH